MTRSSVWSGTARSIPMLEPRIVTVQSALGAPGAAAAEGYYSSWPLEPVGIARHPILRGDQAPGHAVRKLVTLDDLVASLNLPRVDLVKIDVDGGELDVLAGATGVMARDSPTVVFEACPYLLAERGRTLDRVARRTSCRVSTSYSTKRQSASGRQRMLPKNCGGDSSAGGSQNLDGAGLVPGLGRRRPESARSVDANEREHPRGTLEPWGARCSAPRTGPVGPAGQQRRASTLPLDNR